MARLPLITSKDQVAEKDRAIVDSIVASRGALQGPFTMFLHCPELAGVPSWPAGWHISVPSCALKARSTCGFGCWRR